MAVERLQQVGNPLTLRAPLGQVGEGVPGLPEAPVPRVMTQGAPGETRLGVAVAVGQQRVELPGSVLLESLAGEEAAVVEPEGAAEQPVRRVQVACPRPPNR